MSKILRRVLVSAFVVLAAAVLLSFPANTFASEGSVLFENDYFSIERISDGEFVYFDKLTGEEATLTGSLKKSGDTATIVDADGEEAVVQMIGNAVYLDGKPFITELDVPETRTCVEITRKRYSVDTRVGNWVQTLLSLAATAVGGAPGAFLAGIITYLQDLTPTTAYIETIRYYCDTPSPREKYVTNYYSDASYTKLEYSYTSEMVY